MYIALFVRDNTDDDEDERAVHTFIIMCIIQVIHIRFNNLQLKTNNNKEKP
jgi:hypothetical protein